MITCDICNRSDFQNMREAFDHTGDGYCTNYRIRENGVLLSEKQ